MKIWKLLSILLLTGCSATQISYSPEPVSDREDAVRIIEQVVMEQPAKYRPGSVLVTDDYIAFDEGFETRTSGFGVGNAIGKNTAIATGTSRSVSKAIGGRIYFNSVAVPNLYKKRDWYVVDVLDSKSRRLKRIYTLDEKKAEAFIDSFSYFADHAEPIK